MTVFLRGLALALGLSLFAVACGDDATDTDAAAETTEESSETTEAMEETETTEAMEEAETTEAMEDAETTEAMEDEGTIVDVATEAGSFTTLLAAAEAAGLVETLSGDGPLTVFAPTDDAFAAALEDLGLTAEELLASDDLSGILTYHVVSGEVLAADVVELDGQSVATVNGAEVDITVDGETVMVNDATVVTADVTASNGVIHVIDKVLLP
ncbi:MAG: fasciclin domain-containing protein [Acidimicrobiales bacterium]